MGKRLDKAIALVGIAPEAALMALSDVCIAAARAHRMFRARIARELSSPEDVNTVLSEYVERQHQKRAAERDPMDFMVPQRDATDDRAPGMVMVD